MPPYVVHPCTFVHPQYVQTPPYIFMPPFLCTYVCISHLSWGLGGICTPICLGVLWGASVYLSGRLVSVGTSIWLSVHSSHASCSHHGGLLLYCLLCFMLFLIILNCSLLLALCFINVWCQPRALPAPVPMAMKMSASKWILYFSSHSAAFGFQSSTPPDNLTFTSANRRLIRVYQNFKTGRLIRVYQISNWHWCCCLCHS